MGVFLSEVGLAVDIDPCGVIAYSHVKIFPFIHTYDVHRTIVITIGYTSGYSMVFLFPETEF